jgi:DNA-binding SARP family transcriptional activator
MEEGNNPVPFCRIELLGGLRVLLGTTDGGERVVTRFRSQKFGGLLAYLAYHSRRPHPRELLIELFWPESDPAAARVSLRQALASLRRQLEPPGTPPGSVLQADRLTAQINPAGVTTDVADFSAALHQAARASSPEERARRLAQAVELYRGELLPHSFQEWVIPERQRLQQRCLQALDDLTRHFEAADQTSTALRYADQTVHIDALREEG